MKNIVSNRRYRFLKLHCTRDTPKTHTKIYLLKQFFKDGCLKLGSYVKGTINIESNFKNWRFSPPRFSPPKFSENFHLCQIKSQVTTEFLVPISKNGGGDRFEVYFDGESRLKLAHSMYLYVFSRYENAIISAKKQ